MGNGRRGGRARRPAVEEQPDAILTAQGAVSLCDPLQVPTGCGVVGQSAAYANGARSGARPDGAGKRAH